jgi:hypothetical protein
MANFNVLVLNSGADNQQCDETPEAAVLDDMFAQSAQLAEYQNTLERYPPPTLRKEFELAKIVGRNGNRREAEYHCREILKDYNQIDVQAFLGMILANDSRLEESRLFLFGALTCFILRFGDNSAGGNASLWDPICSLFFELLNRSEQDWSPSASCWLQMEATIRTSICEGTIDQFAPQLVIHGFAFAHECSALGFIDSAKYMYYCLLRRRSLRTDMAVYGIEKATAHREYGGLLRREEKWKSGAKQLFLASESAMNSAAYDGELSKLLKRDYLELFPHLAFEANEEYSVLKRIGEMLAQIQRQNSSHIRAASEAIRSRLKGYFDSDLPIQFATHEHSANASMAQVVSRQQTGVGAGRTKATKLRSPSGTVYLRA